MGRGTPFSGSGTLIFIVFDVDSNNLNDSSSLDIIEASLNGGDVTTETDSGKITIVDTPPPGTVVISVPKNLTVPSGTTTVRIPVNLSDVTGLDIISTNLTLSYDANVLSAIGATHNFLSHKLVSIAIWVSSQ